MNDTSIRIQKLCVTRDAIKSIVNDYWTDTTKKELKERLHLCEFELERISSEAFNV